MSATLDHDFEALLDFIKQNRGFDFTGYKRSTLSRRVRKRMEVIGVDSHAEYLERLIAEPEEFTRLFDTLLINVTRFFRDDQPWQFLEEHVIPALVARVPEGQPIRIWSAGCASGEEAYSVAMLLAEALGMTRFRDQVKIYATDADEDALARARLATYSDEQAGQVRTELRDRYMYPADGRWTFRKELRRAVIFGRNDLVQDAPISRIDLLLCRNTLMYFTAATQAAIIARFHLALADGGVLFLGRAETLLTHVHAFVPVNLKWRIFSRVPRTSMRERPQVPSPQARPRDPGHGDTRLREAAFEAGGESQIVVSEAGILTMLNERARQMFSLGRLDVGRPLQDLELSYRPAELRSLIDRCYAERTRILQREVKWRPREALEDCWLTVEVSPLTEHDGTIAGASVVFKDVTEALHLHQELEHAKQHLETAYEELQSTNEELETTNEELQSTVEELETTNEELQSTNEELETMNEELHSANEELQSMNDELRRRGDELNRVNGFTDAVFASMRGAVVVLDREMRVLVWNAQAEELWGLRAEEVLGSNFVGLDIGFPVDQLVGRIRQALQGQREVSQTSIVAVNRRGRTIACEVTCSPLRGLDGGVLGVIVTMAEEEPAA